MGNCREDGFFVMVIYIDIDNTICITDGMDYAGATPIRENIAKANRFFDQGHQVVYWTARGVGSGIDHRVLTEKQLKEWGAKYHELRLDKPVFDLFIDDKVMNAEDWGYEEFKGME